MFLFATHLPNILNKRGFFLAGKYLKIWKRHKDYSGCYLLLSKIFYLHFFNAKQKQCKDRIKSDITGKYAPDGLNIEVINLLHAAKIVSSNIF